VTCGNKPLAAVFLVRRFNVMKGLDGEYDRPGGSCASLFMFS